MATPYISGMRIVKNPAAPEKPKHLTDERDWKAQNLSAGRVVESLKDENFG